MNRIINTFYIYVKNFVPSFLVNILKKSVRRNSSVINEYVNSLKLFRNFIKHILNFRKIPNICLYCQCVFSHFSYFFFQFSCFFFRFIVINYYPIIFSCKSSCNFTSNSARGTCYEYSLHLKSPTNLYFIITNLLRYYILKILKKKKAMS